MPGEGAMRTRIDENNAVAGERLAQRGDRRRRVDGSGAPVQILDVVEPRRGLDRSEPFATARRSGRKRWRDLSGTLMHEIEKGVTAPRHDVTEVSVCGQLLHVRVDMNHECLRALAHGPMHGVTLIEPGAEDQEAVEFAAENGGGGMAGAGIAEYPER
jgi:hypothetical protein